MVARVIAFGLSLFLIPPPGILAAPQAPAAANSTPTNQQPDVIHSSTRLVQLSVITQDSKGEPLTGLQKDDFTVFDEGKPQNIAFFSCVAPPPATPPATLPSNIFTNRFDLKGEDPGAVTVILFDTLNTSPEDQSFVRKEFSVFFRPSNRRIMLPSTRSLRASLFSTISPMMFPRSSTPLAGSRQKS